MNDFLLMKDSSEGDKGKEAMLDFVLSWTCLLYTSCPSGYA